MLHTLRCSSLSRDPLLRFTQTRTQSTYSHLVSHKELNYLRSYQTSFNIDDLFGLDLFPVSSQAREQALRGNRDIYVLGAANVGKSTFINYIIEDR